MISILFTKLNPEHFDASIAGSYSDVMEDYGIDAPDWIPSGGCVCVSGSKYHNFLREDVKVINNFCVTH